MSDDARFNSFPSPVNDRYERQRRLPQIGKQGQKKIASSTVMIVGCGALGSVQAELLARAGVGHLRLVDRDLVELSNLQRQFLYDTDDATQGRPKAEAAARHLRRINPEVHSDPRVVDLNPGNVLSLLAGVDLVLDGSDNFETRFVINDACVSRAIPWVYGGAVATSGMLMPVLPAHGPCLRCLLPDPPASGSQPSCDSVGVAGPLTAAVASLQSMQALRFLVGDHSDAGQLSTLELWPQNITQHHVPRNADCPCCGEGCYPFLNGEQTTLVTTLCGRNAVQFLTAETTNLNLSRLAACAATQWTTQRRRSFVEIKAGDLLAWVFADARVIVKGTLDIARARALRDRILGA